MIPAEWFGWIHYKTDIPPTEKAPVGSALLLLLLLLMSLLVLKE